MLEGQIFYHSTTRHMTAAFGTLFNDLHLVRTDSQGGQVEDIKVPLAYASKQHYIRKIKEASLADGASVAAVLPRISFELTGLTYDATRQTNPLGYISGVNDADPKVLQRMFAPVPYNFEFEVNIFVKNTEDGLQLIEQILPWFTPEFSLTIIEIPQLNYKVDVPVTLQGVTPSDNAEAGFDDNRLISWTLQFSCQGYVFKPINDARIIKQVLNNVYNYTSELEGLGELDVVVDPLTAAIDNFWTADITITEGVSD